MRRHEAIVETAFRQAGEERDHGFGVLLADRPEPDSGAVPQDDVGVEIGSGDCDRHGYRRSTAGAMPKPAIFGAFRRARFGAAGNPASLG